ncbi:MAG: DegT/DnrJ/EryC1/StrS family aminotransferase [Bacteroidetes bacterium]|nr:DegT/DnrJ/EryC1/StrS family aminotransferase [Bacteroidota bacterium]
MRPIQMVDLQSQYENIKHEVDEAVFSVIRSARFILGPDVRQFEEELMQYTGAKNVIACANGTDALKIALIALELKPGDEIIAPTFTFISTAEVAALLGLKVVFADSLYDTFNIDPASIRKAITRKTKAIIPVHLYGQCAAMDEIMKIAKENKIFVIEDNAQAIGAEYFFKNGTGKKAGTIGDAGTTSFFPSKNLGAYGDGGAIFTDNSRLAEKLRMIANHGQKKRYFYDAIGLNSRLDTLQAAILRVKLKKLDGYITARRKAADYYDKAFSGLKNVVIPYRQAQSTHVFHQYTLKVIGGSRDGLMEHLQKNNIPSMLYYPMPLHLQRAFRGNRWKRGDFPVAEKLAKQIISLPMHTELDEEQLEYITKKAVEYFG